MTPPWLRDEVDPARAAAATRPRNIHAAPRGGAATRPLTSGWLPHRLCKALTGGGLPSWVNRAAGYGRWLGLGAKGFQVGGDAAPAPAPAAAAPRDPNYTKKKELTEHQKRLLAGIQSGG